MEVKSKINTYIIKNITRVIVSNGESEISVQLDKPFFENSFGHFINQRTKAECATNGFKGDKIYFCTNSKISFDISVGDTLVSDTDYWERRQ